MKTSARMLRPEIALCAALALALLSAPAFGEEPTGTGDSPRVQSPGAEEQGRGSEQAGLDEDPFEPFNRVMFDVNMKFDADAEEKEKADAAQADTSSSTEEKPKEKDEPGDENTQAALQTTTPSTSQNNTKNPRPLTHLQL